MDHQVDMDHQSKHSGTTPQPTATGQIVDIDKMCQLILDIRDANKRENALLELSKKRESIPDLPVWLWQSYGTMTCLLQEVISIYPAIMPPTLTAVQSNRVCNALALNAVYSRPSRHSSAIPGSQNTNVSLSISAHNKNFKTV
ncbi:CCR4-NOT transcription complex subunit 9 [Aphelenchoides bicaudatus]|nr:CCR4-NOT transcription complex subunit 9 [Aphelenchoides bicaudatus]